VFCESFHRLHVLFKFGLMDTKKLNSLLFAIYAYETTRIEH
jgi:hypothetical protein